VESADNPSFFQDLPDTSGAATASSMAYSKTAPSRTFEERQLHVFEGILAGSIKEMMKEDIAQDALEQ
jgi:hypothetical protein